MSSTSTQEAKMPEWQEDFIRENILPLGVDIAGQDYTPYEGEMVAGMTPLQRQSLRDYRGIDTGGEVYGQAIGAQQGLTGFSPVSMSAQGQIGVDKLASTDLGAYMSPYTQNVIDRSLETLGGAQSQSLNKMDAAATAAKAFGGSRHGIAEAGTREGYAKQAGDLVSGLQERAFTQALQSAQFDIGNVQQAREAAAARAQAANAANYQGQFQAAGIQSAAANAMAGLAGQQLSSQLSGLGAQMSAGDQQRALRQAQLQADYAAFQQQQAYPLTQLNALLAAGSGVPAGLGTTTVNDPFGGLRAVGQVAGAIGGMGQGGFFRGGNFFPQ